MFGFYEFNRLCSVYSVCGQSRGYFSASVWDVFRAFVFWLLYWLYCFWPVCLSVCLSLHIDVWIKIIKVIYFINNSLISNHRLKGCTYRLHVTRKKRSFFLSSWLVRKKQWIRLKGRLIEPTKTTAKCMLSIFKIQSIGNSIAQSRNACRWRQRPPFVPVSKNVHANCGFYMTFCFRVRNLGPQLQNFVKWTFVILSQFFRISFVCQLISYRTVRKVYERTAKELRCLQLSFCKKKWRICEFRIQN